MTTPVWSSITPVTQAASPAFSPWIMATSFQQVIANWTATGGTTAVAAQWSFDGGATVNSTIGDKTLTSGTAQNVLAPYVRFKITQTVADMTAFAFFAQGISS